MSWVIDKRHVVHDRCCTKKGKKPTLYAVKVSYSEMRTHLARPDRSDKNHTGAAVVKPCPVCIPEV